MRNIFVKNLINFARQDKDLYLLTADLGFRALEPFRDEFPDRFINVGIAEANMIGIATGLALMGKKVCVYSIVPFVTIRCLEQIRNDICWHNFDIKIIGIGGGFSYGNQGISHNTTEDIAIMRTLPNMSIFNPGNKDEAEAMSKIFLAQKGPSYIRLGKAGNKEIYPKNQSFVFGKGLTIKNGKDLTLVTSGNMLEIVIDIYEKLTKNNYSVRVISLPIIKPLDQKIILKAAKETKRIFVIEENSIIGSLGGAIAEMLLPIKLTDFTFQTYAVNDKFPELIGSPQFLRNSFGLSADKITVQILRKIKNKK